jgi:diguanylate cyclase (GGDEF)-like protein
MALVGALANRHRTREKNLFNVANFALAIAASRVAYASLQPTVTDLEPATLLGMFATVVTFQLVNVGLISLVVSLHAGESFAAVVRGSAWYAPNKLAVGLIGGCVALVQGQLGPLGALVFALPLAVLRYTLTLHARQTRRTIEALEHQARHDQLTGLPNRLLLLERTQAALDLATQDGGLPGALLLIDLDRFKEVNDTFGHYAGDRVLEQIGRRLREGVMDSALVARLGGDEFAVLLEGVTRAQAEDVSRQLLGVLDEAVVVEGQRLRAGGSIGLVDFPADGADPDTLLRRADVAMYVAKRTRSGFVRYERQLDEHTPERLALAAELREAIEQDELVLFYQPQVELASGRVTSVEALVRWPHPRRGLIPPGEFLAMAENTGQMEQLTRCVLRIALRQCRSWLNTGRNLRISVNVFANDLHDGFPEVVARLLSDHRVPARWLQLEITEDAMMTDPQRAEKVLRQLHQIGVGISIDDFGTGYSSLAYLGQLPLDELKIDRSFIVGMRQSARLAAIVRSTVGLAHDLGLVVVAEGVEDNATADQIREFGCDVLQGYLASKPLEAAVLEEWLKSRTFSGLQLADRAA